MPAAILTDAVDLLAVTAPAAAIDLAAPSLARYLHLSEPEAKALLASGRLRLGHDAAPLKSLLRALGIALQPVAQTRLALALFAAVPDAAMVAAVSAVLPAETALTTGLAQFGGVILPELMPAEADMLRQRLRRVAGLSVTASDPVRATYDVFACLPIDAASRRALSAHLALAGLAARRYNGALASDLHQAQAQQIMARFADCGLIALDRAFQRYDLYLTGIGTLSPQDVAEFLATRTDLSGAMLECVTPLNPLRIERGLSRSAAHMFCADYAAIGLETCARLCGMK